jgi:NAD(P)H dehydrogenase (quinone)
MTKILVLYYSSWGHIEQMAKAAAEGAAAAGAEAVSYTHLRAHETN